MQPDKKNTNNPPGRRGIRFRRSGALLTSLILILAFTGLSLPTQPARARPLPAAPMSGQEILQLVNQVRAGRGLPALNSSGALNAAAQAHSDYMASIGSTSHSGADGSSPATRAIAAGYGGGAAVSVTENVYGSGSAQQAVSWWQNEGLHLETMISTRYTDAGAGGSGGYWTLLVGAVTGAPGSAATQVAWSTQATGAAPAGGGSGAGTTTEPPVYSGVTSTPGPDGSVVHIVQSGETLWSISALYDVSILDILTFNGLNANSSVIQPGDEIIIKEGGAMPTATTGFTNSEGTPVDAIETDETTETPRATRTPRPTSTVVSLAAVENEPGASTPAGEEPARKSPPAMAQVRAKFRSLGVDPMLALIGGVVLVGLVLLAAGSWMKRAEE